jgi:hypothetical protein
MPIGQPDSPECKATTITLMDTLVKAEGILKDLHRGLAVKINEGNPSLENPKLRRGNLSAMAEGPENMAVVENGEEEDKNLSDLDAINVIKEESVNLSKVIVDLIITNQVGDKPERIHKIRLGTELFLNDLKDLDRADIKPETKEKIIDQMKANMSAILEEILTH